MTRDTLKYSKDIPEKKKCKKNGYLGKCLKLEIRSLTIVFRKGKCKLLINTRKSEVRKVSDDLDVKIGECNNLQNIEHDI